MLIRLCLLIVPLLFTTLSWGENAGRPDLNGTWQVDPSKSEVHTHLPPQLTWQIEQSDNSIHLTQRSGESKDSDEFKCGTDGKDCKIKEEGHPAVVSFYYNGPVLVELESEGANHDTVTKKRLHLSSDGSTLTVEVIHVVPSDKPPEKLVLTKQAAAAGEHIAQK